jgi:hypothetical protein
MKICVVLLGIQPRDAGIVAGSLTGIFTRPILAAKSKGDVHTAATADGRRPDVENAIRESLLHGAASDRNHRPELPVVVAQHIVIRAEDTADRSP